MKDESMIICLHDFFCDKFLTALCVQVLFEPEKMTGHPPLSIPPGKPLGTSPRNHKKYLHCMD